ncbi:hypothetical protein LMG19083_05028 [Ralstonia psammae]|uniref:Resolvase/invertase-type recombinase catalytic domain-containing protein n=1 Tax=Ralstonia psammae TaxID=3058598 RepID=A0ABM9K036_9RALS|nr:recombinase family protein [Ralstonia sp. LMG 19083]CAJ0809805.1 hypothetical protein LMG19083_05028 [Ralstonia sp. LMG 19083]
MSTHTKLKPATASLNKRVTASRTTTVTPRRPSETCRARHTYSSPHQPVRVGYARVSTDTQNLRLQLDALRRVDCAHVFTDEGISGSEFSRPGLDEALACLQEGDTLVVWRLDRLGRSLGKLVELINELGQRKIKFESIMETINTGSSGGKLVFHMIAALAEFERSLISERTRAGMAAARAHGKRLGRKPALSATQQRKALALLSTEPATAVAKRFNVHPRTLRRLLDSHNAVGDGCAVV